MANKNNTKRRWKFWIDRGGTFTDVIGIDEKGQLHIAKVLSVLADDKKDAAVMCIKNLLKLDHAAKLSAKQVEVVKMGTTVATNALLERKGNSLALIITKGFGDTLTIRDQTRQDLFELFPTRNDILADHIIEVEERILADGSVEQKPNLKRLGKKLEKIRNQIDTVAIACVHGYRYQQHEQMIAKYCDKQKIPWVFQSHKSEPVAGLVKRSETTVIDAYLTPILKQHVDRVKNELGDIRLQFMQSNGGLSSAAAFSGCKAVLSGPAGGVIGAIAIAKKHGMKRIVSLDMGGTSTDVAHFDGELERTSDAKIAGMSLATPMLLVNTVAAGGGSVCWFSSGRLQVGPHSAGARPGPACYGNGGPLTVTDCNLTLGRLVVETFPKVFGQKANAALNSLAAQKKLKAQAKITGENSLEKLAEAYIDVAVENMSKALKSISVQRGHDLTKDYALVAFGGAGGQHACQIAERTGIYKVLIHPLAGVQSAAGIGLAATRSIRRQTLEVSFNGNLKNAQQELDQLAKQTLTDTHEAKKAGEKIFVEKRLLLRYSGSSSSIAVKCSSAKKMLAEFTKLHQKIYAISRTKIELIISAVEVEAFSEVAKLPNAFKVSKGKLVKPSSTQRLFANGKWHTAKVYQRTLLCADNCIAGPALIIENTSTTYAAPSWQATMQADGSLHMQHKSSKASQLKKSKTVKATPDRLEVFHSVFTSIAEQMGYVLQNTAFSVNIKERLDFSCALFDAKGALVANAPHIPVHLGSMGATVEAVIKANKAKIKKGDAWLVNAPYAGGTHLPDLTVVSPVFRVKNKTPSFYVCSRGHHTDVGGITPGSMPSNSKHLAEEGIVFDNFKLVSAGKLNEKKLRLKLSEGKYPARDPEQNVADLLAQLAANAKGTQELMRACDEHGDKTVSAFMAHIQNNAAEAVTKLLGQIKPGTFEINSDSNGCVKVAVRLNSLHNKAVIDFTGTSAQDAGNLNAPKAVTIAAVYYVLRCLVKENIPLNAGCLRNIKIILPENSMVNPNKNAAVAAGNVEVSQMVVDALLGALNKSASSQGTMNNLTFGNANYQYYETVCGGTGAGPLNEGTDAIHSHMTNTRITDVEVLENRLPVVLEQFAIRPNSQGKGRNDGGKGVSRSLRFLKAMQVSMLANRRKVAPTGMAKGQAGAKGKNWLRSKSGKITPGAGRHVWQVKPGDVFELRTPGGGGWGNKDGK